MKQEDKTINIIAEAFQISVEFIDLGDDNRLDFGTVKVKDIMEKYFTIKNNGLYEIKYKFVMRKQNYR